MKRKNPMGSNVEDGYICKPEQLDNNKPIMYSAIHLFICDGERCQQSGHNNLADKLRQFVKESGYDRGINRIKVTRTHCNGACRFRVFAYAYVNITHKNILPEQNFFAWKNVQHFSENDWKYLFQCLVNGENPNNLDSNKVTDMVY